jgi:hypothetical protein
VENLIVRTLQPAEWRRFRRRMALNHGVEIFSIGALPYVFGLTDPHPKIEIEVTAFITKT